jgi:putative hydrolase of the HAD superfamily
LQTRQIKAVIFDLDDTLIDWSNLEVKWDVFHFGRVEKARNYLTENGHQLPEPQELYVFIKDRLQKTWDDARQDWAIPSMAQVMHQILIDLGISAEQVDMEALLTHYNWGVFPGVVPFDDTHQVLETLRQQDYKIGLVTNSIFSMWMRDVELEAYNLIDYFDARITSGDIGYLKPHPQIYHRILEMLDVRPDQAVFVGDRPQNDIAGANEVGLTSVLMSPPHLERDLDGIQPDHTINTLSELLPILEKLA